MPGIWNTYKDLGFPKWMTDDRASKPENVRVVQQRNGLLFKTFGKKIGNDYSFLLYSIRLRGEALLKKLKKLKKLSV